jgi:hypothetical protein
MDQERNEMSRALQHHHDTYNERHINDDGFSNLELNDPEKHDENIIKTNHHQELAKVHEKNYEVFRKKKVFYFLIKSFFYFSKFGQWQKNRQMKNLIIYMNLKFLNNVMNP